MKRGRLLALVLSLTMIFSAAAFVYADEGSNDGTTTIEVAQDQQADVTTKADQEIKVTAEREVVIGKTIKLDAKLAKGKGSLSFVSSDSSIATVSKKGVLKAKSAGAVTIKITAPETEKFNAAEAEVKVTVIPKTVVVTSLVCKKGGKFTVKWDKLKGVDGYELQYCKVKSFKNNVKAKKVKSEKPAKVTIKKLKKGTKYYVRIRTYKTVDGVKYYSKWSKVKMIKIK